MHPSLFKSSRLNLIYNVFYKDFLYSIFKRFLEFKDDFFLTIVLLYSYLSWNHKQIKP